VCETWGCLCRKRKRAHICGEVVAGRFASNWAATGYCREARRGAGSARFLAQSRCLCPMGFDASEKQIMHELLELSDEADVCVSARALARCFADKVQRKRPPPPQISKSHEYPLEKKRRISFLSEELCATLPCGQEINVDFVGFLKDRLDSWYLDSTVEGDSVDDAKLAQKLSMPPSVALEDVDIFMTRSPVLYVCKNCRRPVIESRVYEHILRCCPDRWVPLLNECAKQVTNVATQFQRNMCDSDLHNVVLSFEFPEIYFSQLLDDEDGAPKTRFGRHAKRVGKVYDSQLLFMHGMQSARAISGNRDQQHHTAPVDADLSLYRSFAALSTVKVTRNAGIAETNSRITAGNVATEAAKCRAFHRKYFWPRIPYASKPNSAETESMPDRLDPLARLLYLNMSWERIMQMTLPPAMKKKVTSARGYVHPAKEQLSTKEELLPASTNTIAHAILRLQSKRSFGSSWLIDPRQLSQNRTTNGIFHGQSFFAQPGTFWTDPSRQLLPRLHQAPTSTQRAVAASLSSASNGPSSIRSQLSDLVQRRNSVPDEASNAASTERNQVANAAAESKSSQASAGIPQRLSSLQYRASMPSPLGAVSRQSAQPASGANAGHGTGLLTPGREVVQETMRHRIAPDLVEWLRRDPFFLQMTEAAKERVLVMPNLTPEMQQQALEALEQRLMQERLRAIAQAVVFAREMPQNSRARMSATSLLSTLHPMNESQRKALGEMVRQLLITQRASTQPPRPPDRITEAVASEHSSSSIPSPASFASRTQRQGLDARPLQRLDAPREASNGSKADTDAEPLHGKPGKGAQGRHRSDVDLLAAIDRALGIRRDPE